MLLKYITSRLTFNDIATASLYLYMKTLVVPADNREKNASLFFLYYSSKVCIQAQANNIYHYYLS